MHLEYIAREPLAVQIHLFTVVPAFLLGTWLIFFSRKGSRYHRAIGAAYLTLMSITAATAIFIRQLRPGQFSYFHLFIPLVAWGVFSAIWNIRRRNIRGHQAAMLGMYFGGLVIAGALTFMPGRLMFRIFFG